MSNFQIVDTHVHLWDLNQIDYDWLEDIPELYSTHSVSEYDIAVGDAIIEKFIFVECTVAFDNAISRDEVEWVTSLADNDPRLAGIVAHASLEKPADIHAHLEWLSRQPLVKGVRRLLQDEPESFFREPNLINGLQLLADYDFSFDLTVRAEQLPQAIELIERCPNVNFVLDHMGKPNIRENRFEKWAINIRTLAELPNVTCKVSGLLTEANVTNWTADDIYPYVVHALNTFGVDRVIFGSDWPVLRLAATYVSWLDLLERLLDPFPIEQRQKLFRSNAERIYRL